MKILITTLLASAAFVPLATTTLQGGQQASQQGGQQGGTKGGKKSRVDMRVLQVDEILAEHNAKKKRYTPFFKVPSLNTGIYTLPKDGKDGQSPHKEDEIYYVLAGKAKMESGGRKEPVRKGSMVFVAAGVEHRFVDIEEDLELFVVFSSGPKQGPGHVKKVGRSGDR